MILQPLGAKGAVLHCPLSELARRGLDPASLTWEEALDLAREVGGLPPGRIAGVEVCSGRDGLLLFVSFASPTRPGGRRPPLRGRVRRTGP